MKEIEITNVPKGANVLIAHDNGTGIVTKDDEIELYKYDGDGIINLTFNDSEEVIIRVRCANSENGYWKPMEVQTKDIPSEESFFTTEMREDRFLNK